MINQLQLTEWTHPQLLQKDVIRRICFCKIYFDLECLLLYIWPCYFHTSFVSNGKIASRNKNSYLKTRLLNFSFPSSIIEKMSQNISNSNLIWSKSHSIFSAWLVVSWKEAISYFFSWKLTFFCPIVLFPQYFRWVG